MIYTSNFATCMNTEGAVSIAGAAPQGFRGRQYRKLAPKLEFFKKYKEDGDTEHYVKCYQAQVLDTLNAQRVWQELNDPLGDVFLLCYEKPGEFCHRRLVAQWFELNLGIVVPEYKT